MQARYESAKVDAENSVDLVGISFSKDSERSGVLANRLIMAIEDAFPRTVHFTVLPSMAVARIDLPKSLVSIGGLPFARWNSKQSEDWLDAVGGEEVLMLLSETETAPSMSSTIKAGNLWQKARQLIHLDPYQPFKRVGLDGKTIAAFYSASHKDLEIYFPPKFKKQLFELLKGPGVRGLPEHS